MKKKYRFGSSWLVTWSSLNQENPQTTYKHKQEVSQQIDLLQHLRQHKLNTSRERKKLFLLPHPHEISQQIIDFS